MLLAGMDQVCNRGGIDTPSRHAAFGGFRAVNVGVGSSVKDSVYTRPVKSID
jgi:hypothetical protein